MICEEVEMGFRTSQALIDSHWAHPLKFGYFGLTPWNMKKLKIYKVEM